MSFRCRYIGNINPSGFIFFSSKLILLCSFVWNVSKNDSGRAALYLSKFLHFTLKYDRLMRTPL